MSWDKTFITGVDKNLQDLLPWWIENIRRHDKETHITVCDFGMTEDWSNWTKKNVNTFLKYPPHKHCAWYYKPHTLIKAPYEYKCWIDIDCEVLTNITDIFDYVDGTNIGFTNDPCRTREDGDPNPKWFATGVNVVKGNPKILKIWDRWTRPSDGVGSCQFRGDQESMHTLLSTGTLHESVVELPMEYQWLRIQLVNGQDNPNKKIVHWTGPRGKEIIRNKIRGN